MERERLRETEATQRGKEPQYELVLQRNAAARERARSGKIVIKGKERPWQQNRQSLVKMFLSTHGIDDTAARNWTCFIVL